MTLITISVTQDDIDHGIAADCRNCPVARAVQRAMGDDSLRAYSSVYRDYKHYAGYICQLPQKAINWICQFDLHEPVSPFTFTLTIPDTDPVAVRLAELELTARGD